MDKTTINIIVVGIIGIGLASLYLGQIELASVALGSIAGYLGKEVSVDDTDAKKDIIEDAEA